jgi:stage II sporulation protein D
VRPALALLLVAACGSRNVAPPPERVSTTPPPTTTTDPPPEAPLDPTPATIDAPAKSSSPQLGRPPRVQVTLSRSAVAGRAKVLVKGAWTLVGVDGATIRSGASLDGELVLAATGATLVGAAFPDDSELRCAAEGDLRVDGRAYAGALRVERGADGKRRPLIVTDVETYVAQVVNSEIPAAFPREAQLTQAVLARTYVLSSTVRTSPDAPLLVVDVGGVDQEFAGLAPVAEHRRIALDAATSTRGMVLVTDGAPFVAYYHSTCGGTTCPGTAVFGKTASAPPLAGGVACPWCAGSKYAKWETKIPAGNVVKAAGMAGVLESFVCAETTAGGRATSFEVKAGGKTKRVPAAEFRLRVGASTLRSVLLDLAIVDGGDLVVKGRGWGHGVGLCQMGAKTLAEQGKTAEQILAVYYPGSTLERRW